MIEIFGLPVRMYGITAALGIWVAFSITERISWQVKLPKKVVENGLIWVLIPGIIGARLFHVVDLWEVYSQNLISIIQIWHGGIGIMGGFVGGFVGVLVYVRVAKLSILDAKKLLDSLVFGIPIGQAIGRWGNFFNQELYGGPSNLPWAITIDSSHRLPGFESIARYHPLFLYEGMLNLCLFGLLLYLFSQKPQKVGTLLFFSVYAIGYGMIRFFLEFVRLEPTRDVVLGISVAQYFALVMIVVGGLILYRGGVKRR